MSLQADIIMDDSSFRRRSHRESNGGHSGYVPVDDEYLQHSGVRGKRGCCLCTLLVILLLVAVINALVSDHLLQFLAQPFLIIITTTIIIIIVVMSLSKTLYPMLSTGNFNAGRREIILT